MTDYQDALVLENAKPYRYSFCQADILDSVDHGFGSHLCHDLT